jgi:hypothetical protein
MLLRHPLAIPRQSNGWIRFLNEMQLDQAVGLNTSDRALPWPCSRSHARCHIPRCTFRSRTASTRFCATASGTCQGPRRMEAFSWKPSEEVMPSFVGSPDCSPLLRSLPITYRVHSFFLLRENGGAAIKHPLALRKMHAPQIQLRES